MFESGEAPEANGVAGVNEQCGIEQPELESDFLPGGIDGEAFGKFAPAWAGFENGSAVRAGDSFQGEEGLVELVGKFCGMIEEAADRVEVSVVVREIGWRQGDADAVEVVFETGEEAAKEARADAFEDGEFVEAGESHGIHKL